MQHANHIQLSWDEVVDLVESILELNLDQVLPAYSGRAMYGAECLGLTFDSFSEAFSRFVLADFSYLSDYYGWSEVEIESLVERLANVSHDSMGYGIVLYWRGIEVDKSTIPNEFYDLV